MAEVVKAKRKKRRCTYCLDKYQDHSECLTYLELEHAVIVEVINVEAQLGIHGPPSREASMKD